MKYKILKGTALFNSLLALHGRIQQARAEIRRVVEELGYKEYVVSSDYLIACSGIQIFGDKPEGWRKVGGKWEPYYLPTQKNKEVAAKIAALPMIRNEELNTIVGFHWQIGDNLAVFNRPGFVQRDDYALIEVGSGCKFDPLPDMIEITGSEYKKLSEETVSEKQTA